MNIKLVLASVLAIGSSTVALADAAPASVTVTAPAPQIFHRWEMLATGAKIAPTGRDTIQLGQTRPLKKIMLEATSGKTQVDQVAIKFANGRSEIVRENAVLVHGSTLTIDLPGYHDVTAIRVFGHSSPRGSFEVLGSRA